MVCPAGCPDLSRVSDVRMDFWFSLFNFSSNVDSEHHFFLNFLSIFLGNGLVFYHDSCDILAVFFKNYIKKSFQQFASNADSSLVVQRVRLSRLIDSRHFKSMSLIFSENYCIFRYYKIGGSCFRFFSTYARLTVNR